MNENKKPWLNRKGETLSEEKIQSLSKKWTHKEWESYLASIESPLKEDSVLSVDYIDDLMDSDYANLIFSLSSEERFIHLKAALKLSIDTLSDRQRHIIVRHFWDGEPLTDIAREIGVSRQYIYRAFNAALTSLKSELSSPLFLKRVQLAKRLVAS